MTRVLLETFGGEMPALQVDALPATAAQEAVNLFAGSTDFRPLHEDVTVAACPTGTRTIYRTQRRSGGGFHGVDDEASGWMVHSTERSYVRGQVDDDATERTYVTDNTVGPYPQAFDLSSAGSPRRLGVPAPAKLTTTLKEGDPPFLRADAEEATSAIAQAVRSALIECTIDPRAGVAQQRASRYKNFVPSGGVPGAATLTPRNGPKSNYKMGPTEEIESHLPESYRDHHATLWAVRPISELSAIFGPTVAARLGVVLGTVSAMPLVCLPPSWLAEAPDPDNPGRYLFETRMRAIKNPRDLTQPLFDEGEIVNMNQVFIAGGRMSERVPELIRQLDDVTREFSALVLDTPTPPATTPRPVEPTKPTVPQYVDNTSDPGG